MIHKSPYRPYMVRNGLGSNQTSIGKSRLEAYTDGSEVVNLHYNKAEVSAESFGRGSFPTF
jgi:hypothetical protein